MPSIRPANPDDALALARLAERTFRDTFGAENAAADMDSHCTTHFGEEIQRAEIHDGNSLTLLAEDDGGLVAFAQVWVHSPKPLLTAARPAKLHRLYLAKEWHGQGLAHDVMHAVLEAARLREADALWLSVWERNPRAIAFYRKFGFDVVGEQIFQVGSDPQRDLVMSVKIVG